MKNERKHLYIEMVKFQLFQRSKQRCATCWQTFKLLCTIFMSHILCKLLISSSFLSQLKNCRILKLGSFFSTLYTTLHGGQNKAKQKILLSLKPKNLFLFFTLTKKFNWKFLIYFYFIYNSTRFSPVAFSYM